MEQVKVGEYVRTNNGSIFKIIGGNADDYLIDVEYFDLQKIEDDIDTMLASQNVGIAEKKEHLVVGEVEANNQAIEDSGDDFISNLKEGFDRVKECFQVQVNPELAHEVVSSYNEDEEMEEEDMENDD